MNQAQYDPPASEGTVVVTRKTELTEIAVRNFRNIERLDVDVAANGIMLVGENGEGKSNFLEAIRYLTVLRSPRGARDAELVQHGAEGFFLQARAQLNSGGGHTISAGFERRGKKKRVAIDGGVANRLADALGFFAATLITPSDVELVSGGPAERRRFLDVLLSLLDAQYLHALQRYRAALLRRNSALRHAAAGPVPDEQAVAVWEPPLAEAGAILWRKRVEWCAAASPEYERLCRNIGERGTAALEHATQRGIHALDADELQRALESHRRSDLRNGSTSAGPHRDDLKLAVDGRDLRSFGSGGQRRTAALALRLLELLALRDSQNRWPVLLLDDPFAELDARRSRRILAIVEENGHGQVIMAVPRENEIPREFRMLERWRVEQGAFTRIGHG